MKPKNFPERVNQRRKFVLAKLEAIPLKVLTESNRREIQVLKLRIVEDARASKTKIYRGT